MMPPRLAHFSFTPKMMQGLEDGDALMTLSNIGMMQLVSLLKD
jgi:hypothetical protein